MCLYAMKEDTERMRAEIKESGGKISVWKVLRDEGDDDLRSTTVRNFRWRPGINSSGRKHTRVRFERAKIRRVWNGDWQTVMQISSGLHVCKTRKLAIVYAEGWGQSARIVRLSARAEELVGANETEAVFRSLELSQKEYDKALRAIA